MSEVQQKYTLYGLYEARGSEAIASPWGECKNDGGLDRENDQTIFYWASYEGYVPENNMSNSMTVLTVNTVNPVKHKIRDLREIRDLRGIFSQQLKQLKSTTSARETNNRSFDQWEIRTHLSLKEWHGEYAVSETNIGYRCATDRIVMSSYEPVKNPLWTRSWKREGEVRG